MSETILAYIEHKMQRTTLPSGEIVNVPVTRRAKEGGYVSRDGRTAYYFDGKQLRRVTHVNAMPTGDTEHGA